MILSKRRGKWLVGLVATIQLLGCGKKGPPLAPLVRLPAPLTELAVRRLGNEVYVGFTLPTADQDGTQPADLIRVDVYAMTTQPRLPPDRTLDLEEFQEASNFVDSIEVGPPLFSPGLVSPNSDESEEAGDKDLEVPQGFAIALSELLTPEIQIPVDPWEDEREEPEDEEELEKSPVLVLITPSSSGPLQREYVVVSVTSQGTEMEASERIAVPLGIRPPAPPSAPLVVYTDTEINITWELPPGARESVQAPTSNESIQTLAAVPLPVATPTPPPETVLPNEATAPSTPFVDAPAVVDITTLSVSPLPTIVPVQLPLPTTVPVQLPRVSPPGAATSLSLPSIPALRPLDSRPIIEWAQEAVLGSSSIVEWPPASRYEVFEVAEARDDWLVMPEPLHPEPLTEPAYADNRVEFGTERCYGVRTLDVVAGLEVRSGLSTVTCVSFVDTFRPDAPESLSAVASDGEVSLIWASNEEIDLAGYLVLRGSPQGETLQPLTSAPVTENTYRDTTAEPGVVYAYAVRAVDLAIVPNLSELSSRVEEAAR
ncbi:MAG: hypothetical protein VX453_09470 [Acidobacteriota bacterium]|nr:hypothetical protein [Acidobacteriota bacterium]